MTNEELGALLQHEVFEGTYPAQGSLVLQKLGPPGVWRLVHLSHERAAIRALLTSARQKEQALKDINVSNAAVDATSADKLAQQQRQSRLALGELVACAYGKVVVLRLGDGSLRYYRITQANYGLVDVPYRVGPTSAPRPLYVLNRAAPLAGRLVSASVGECLELPRIGEVEVVAVLHLERHHGGELSENYSNFKHVQLEHRDPKFEVHINNLQATLERELGSLQAKPSSPAVVPRGASSPAPASEPRQQPSPIAAPTLHVAPTPPPAATPSSPALLPPPSRAPAPAAQQPTAPSAQVPGPAAAQETPARVAQETLAHTAQQPSVAASPQVDAGAPPEVSLPPREVEVLEPPLAHAVDAPEASLLLEAPITAPEPRRSEEAYLGAHFYTQTTKMQEDLLRRPPSGLLVVGGIAGSGKTSVALGRTKMLCDRRDEDEDNPRGFEAGFYRPETAVGFVLNVQLSAYLKQTLDRLWLSAMRVQEYGELRKLWLDHRELVHRERRPPSSFTRSDASALEPEGRMAWLRAADRAVAAAIAQHLQGNLSAPPTRAGNLSPSQQADLSRLWSVLASELSGVSKNLQQAPANASTFLLEGLVHRLDGIRTRFTARLEARGFKSVVPALSRQFTSALRLQERYVEAIVGPVFSRELREALKGREPPSLDATLQEAGSRASEAKLSDADVDVLLALYHLATLQSRSQLGWLQENTYFTQVFIDEYQDFSEIQLFFMAEQAHPSRRTVTAVGDRSQRLHGGLVPDLAESFWMASEDERRAVFLLENKRQSGVLACLSQRFRELVLGGERHPELLASQTGEPATLLEVDETCVSKAVRDAVMASKRGQSIVVLCASEATAGRLQAELQDDLATSFRESKLSHQSDLVKRYFVHFTTPLQAKGLEFDAVVVAHLEEFDLKDPTLANACYVALSRPRSQLTLVVQRACLDSWFTLLVEEGLLRRPPPASSPPAAEDTPLGPVESLDLPPPTPSVKVRQERRDMSKDRDAQAQALLARYHQILRPTLQELGVSDMTMLDQAAAVLQAALEKRQQLNLGFLGESQVGKSTLINAILGQRVLPSGGVGPLTAQATRVSYAETGSLEVTYHNQRRFNWFVFGLQQHLAHRKEIRSYDVRQPDGDDGDASLLPVDADDSSERTSKGSYLLSQARLMLCDNQDSASFPPTVLFDALRRVMELPPLGDATRLVSLGPRINDICLKLGEKEQIEAARLPDRASFNKELKLRAAGWMSPLVARLNLALNNPLLRDVTLVDLPGIGVVGDPAGRVAEEFVRQQADALIIVARNNGLTESIARVLESTGVITKLLFGAQGEVAPIHVIIAITQLDQVARDRYTEAVAQAQENEEPLPDRHDIFVRAAGEMAAKVRQQISDALQSSSSFEELPLKLRNRREAIIKELCERMDVLCVSAADYNCLLQGQEDLAFLKRKETTNIPAFCSALRALVDRVTAVRDARIDEAYSLLEEGLQQQFESIKRIENEKSDTLTWRSFRDRLRRQTAPLSEQALANRAATKTFLDEEMPRRLQELTDAAASQGKRQLTRLRNKGANMHWRTLNAALTRHGIYEKRGIDYPGELTRAFVDTIASSWEELVVAEVRQAIRQLVERDTVLIEQLHQLASELDEKAINESQLQVTKRSVAQQAKTAVEWTTDRLEALRLDVSQQLYAAALKPIEQACRKAVQDQVNRGDGTHGRILETFQLGGEKAIDRAKEKSLEALTEHYRALQRQLLSGVLRRNYDPVTTAFETLVSDEVREAKRAGDQAREHRLALLARFAEALAAKGHLPTDLTPMPPQVAMSSDHNVRSAGNDMFSDLVEQKS